MLDDKGLQTIHEKTLGVLKNTGLKVRYHGYHDALREAGADVDAETDIVKFPPKLVETAIGNIRRMIEGGKKQHLLNGIISTKSEPGLKLKFAGACIEFLDPAGKAARAPTKEDLIRVIKLGESIPEVAFVGNPVCYLTDEFGKRVPGPLQRVLTAATVAKYTTKYGSNEVWNDKELDLLLELGAIVRGSEEAFSRNPCFVTAKETIAPLLFPEEDGKVLYMLASRSLPCTIIPMPVSGATSPVGMAANIVIGAAEVLGVQTCINLCFPDAMTGGGVISGIMDMKSASASFAAPEAILQDLGLAMLFEKLYGQNFGIGTGYIDALLPGAQSAMEIYAKMRAAYESGRYDYSCGLLLGGKRFSPVQALISVETARYIERLNTKISTSELDIPMDVIAETGIGGHYLEAAHTLENYRGAMWAPQLMQRKLDIKSEADVMVERATGQWADFLKNCDINEPAVSEGTARQIDEWAEKAVRILSEEQ